MTYSVLFLSSAEIAAPLLNALYNDPRFHIEALICQPDKVAGRGQKLTPPPLKKWAEEKGDITIFQPKNLKKANELLERFQAEVPDFLVTFAYGQILSLDWLKLPKFNALNIHTSLLPKYRGASPIQAALLNGDTESGISLMKMVKEMDAGPVAQQFRIQIDNTMCAEDLHDGLAALAAEKIPDELSAEMTFAEQDPSGVSYCKKILRSDAYIDFSDSSEIIFRKFQAYTPWPALWTRFNGKRLKILDLITSEKNLAVGEISIDEARIFVGCAEGSLELLSLQLEGKRAMKAQEFIVGQSEFSEAHLPS
jgi:methionyl-tRNA formyltransferase